MTRPPSVRSAGPSIIALEGASGVGKTATSRALARAISAVRIPEAFERLRPTPALDFQTVEELVDLETTLLYEESRRFREAVRARRGGGSVVLDTGWLGPVTFTAGLAELDRQYAPALRSVAQVARRLVRTGRLGLPDATVYLDLGARAVAERVAADPAGHPPERAELYAHVASHERRLWLERFPAVSPDRLVAMRADRTVPSIVRSLGRRLAVERPRTPPTDREATRTIRAFAESGGPSRTEQAL